MQVNKAATATKYVERSKDSRLGRSLLHASVVDHDHYAVALARKNREVMEFLAKLRSKSVAK